MASSALRLRLAWIVFQDRMGNLVVIDPDRPRPLGAQNATPRPPTIYFATTSEEFEACAEAMIPVLEANLTVGRRQMALLDRIREFRERLAGYAPRRAAKAPKAA